MLLKSTVETNTKDYVALQCGVFSKKENALILKNSLMNLVHHLLLKKII